MWYNSVELICFYSKLFAAVVELYYLKKSFPKFNRHITFGIKQPRKDKSTKAGFFLLHVVLGTRSSAEARI